MTLKLVEINTVPLHMDMPVGFRKQLSMLRIIESTDTLEYPHTPVV